MPITFYLSRTPGLKRQGLPARRSFQQWVEMGLQHCDYAKPVELSLRLVDEKEGRLLNYQYRHKNYATNVLSFPADFPGGVEPALLGDIVLCAPVVEREAAKQKKLLKYHYAHLTIHGLLHLLGYDHQNAQEAEEMEALEGSILADLNIPDPYTC